MKKIIILFLLSGCYSPVNDTQYKIDSQIQSYLNQFYTIASSQYGKNFDHSNLLISVEYGLASQLHCNGLTTLRNNGGQRQIELDQEFWNESSQGVREILVFHEFGHAFLRRGHTTGISIMNPKLGNYGWIIVDGKEVDHKVLLDELFLNR